MTFSTMQMKIKIVATSVFSLILAGAAWVISQSPITIYEMGRVKAAMSRRHGQVAGVYSLKLPVSFHRQEHSLSCEAAAVTMALNYKGAMVTESEVINKLAFDTTPRTTTTWGNPYAGFVGNIDGRMGITGYGVYWQPIADAANYWRPSEAITNMAARDVATHLLADRPVVAWGFYGSGKTTSWLTMNGQPITAIIGEHARVITGFWGDSENPQGFSLLDPIYGELYWTTEQLMQNWAPFNNTGVVVY